MRKTVRQAVFIALIVMMALAYTCTAGAAESASFGADSGSGQSGISMPADLSDMTEESAAMDELLILVEDGTSKKEIAGMAKEADATLDNVSTLADGSRLARVSLDNPEDAQGVADELLSHDKVLIVQPNYRYRINDDPSEEDVGDIEEGSELVALDGNSQFGRHESIIDGKMITQWYMGKTVYGTEEYGEIYSGSAKVFDSWKSPLLSESGTAVTVAVIDTGAQLNHPDLEKNIISDECVTFNNGNQVSFTALDGKDDDHGHGTHICGLIAADSEDFFGISGVAKNRAKLIVIDAALNEEGLPFTTQDIVCGIEYAVEKHADLINMSVGALYHDYLMEKAINDAFESNVLCVCAAGNEDSELTQSPGDAAGAISVMAHDSAGEKAYFSNHGAEKDVSAPGTDIVSTYIDRQDENRTVYSQLSGTSMASPIVAGLAAFLKSEDSGLNARELKNLIYTSSGNDAFDQHGFGFGKINAVNAVNNTEAEPTVPEAIALNRTSASMYPGEYLSLEYAVQPGTASRHADEVVFATTDSSVADVDESGRITAKAAGTVQITASWGDGTISSACTVKVSNVPYEKITRLPFSQTRTFDPTDPKVRIIEEDGSSWEAIVDGYELALGAAGKPVDIAVRTDTAEPSIRIFDSEGNQMEPVIRKTVTRYATYNAYRLTAVFTPPRAGTFFLEVLGDTEGSATVHKPYMLDISDRNQNTAMAGEAAVKKANGLVASGKTVRIKRKAVRKKAKTLKRAKAISVSGAQGSVTYQKVSGSGKLRIDHGTGDITVKKKTRKGKYRMVVRVTAAGSESVKAASRDVTVTVRVK